MSRFREDAMRRVLAALVAMLAGVAATAVAEEKRAFEIADYYRTAFVGSPAVSPDGTTIAVSVTRYALEAGESWSEIWVFGAHGSRPRQMTRGRHHDGGPVFSPDGKALLFESDRADGGPQLYLMPIDGGEPRQLTDFPTGVSDPVWSPDGRWIAVTSHVYPECGADADCNATIRDAEAGGPLKAYLADELLYRHWASWRQGRYPHVLLVDAATGSVERDLTPGRWDSPTFSLGGGPGYAFSPDSRELCFVSNRDEAPALSTNSDLWVVPLDVEAGAATARNLTAGNAGWDGNPVFSPDGRWIAFLSQERPGFESDLLRVAVYDRERGSVRYLTERGGFDNWATALAWHPSSNELFFQAEVKGRTPLFRVDLGGGKIREVVTDGAISGWEVTATGDAVVYARSKVGAPPEVFRLAVDGGEPTRITSFNADLAAEVDIRPAEELWVDGAGGAKVQVFVVKPHGFDPTRKYPLVLNVHGGPQQQWTDRYRGDWQVYPGKGYIVAFPNPTGSPGFGQDFVDAISCDWGGRVYEDLMKVTDALAAIPYVDADRMGAMGWSYGGYMMMWFAGHTDRFAALAAMMGVYDLRSMHSATEELWFPQHDLCGTPWDSEEDYRKWSPSQYVQGFSTPTLVVTGERDYRVPYTQSLQFFTDLQLMEVPSRLIVFPEAGHWPSWYEMAFYYLAHIDWFHRWLGGEPPSWEVERFLRNQVFGEGGTLGAPSAEGSTATD
jgi:dipeptidyl aminopeptidase/acylaminoacyl peptidase